MLSVARTHFERGVPSHLADVEMRVFAVVGDAWSGKSHFVGKLIGASVLSPTRRRAGQFSDATTIPGDGGVGRSSLIPVADDAVAAADPLRAAASGSASPCAFHQPVSLAMCAGSHGIVVGHQQELLHSDSAASAATGGGSLHTDSSSRLLQVFDQPYPWGLDSVSQDIGALLPVFLAPSSVIAWHAHSAEIAGTRGMCVLEPLFLMCTAVQLFGTCCLRGFAPDAHPPHSLFVVIRDFDSAHFLGNASGAGPVGRESATQQVHRLLFAKENEIGVVGAAVRNKMRRAILEYFGRITVHALPPRSSPLAESAEHGLLIDCFLTCAAEAPGKRLPTARSITRLLGEAAASISIESSPLPKLVTLLRAGTPNCALIEAQRGVNVVQECVAELRRAIEAHVVAAYQPSLQSCGTAVGTPLRAGNQANTDGDVSAAATPAAPQPPSTAALVQDSMKIAEHLARQLVASTGGSGGVSAGAAREKFMRAAASVCETEVPLIVRRLALQRVQAAELEAQRQCARVASLLDAILAAREQYLSSTSRV